MNINIYKVSTKNYDKILLGCNHKNVMGSVILWLKNYIQAHHWKLV